MAVSVSVADLEAAAGLTAVQATRLLPVATALVEQYAPSAPVAVQNEAVVRVCGWMAQTPKTIEKVGAGNIDFTYQPALHKAPLRNSGALSLLSSWKKRRAGAIG